MPAQQQLNNLRRDQPTAANMNRLVLLFLTWGLALFVYFAMDGSRTAGHLLAMHATSAPVGELPTSTFADIRPLPAATPCNEHHQCLPFLRPLLDHDTEYRGHDGYAHFRRHCARTVLSALFDKIMGRPVHAAAAGRPAAFRFAAVYGPKLAVGLLVIAIIASQALLVYFAAVLVLRAAGAADSRVTRMCAYYFSRNNIITNKAVPAIGSIAAKPAAVIGSVSVKIDTMPCYSPAAAPAAVHGSSDVKIDTIHFSPAVKPTAMNGSIVAKVEIIHDSLAAMPVAAESETISYSSAAEPVTVKAAASATELETVPVGKLDSFVDVERTATIVTATATTTTNATASSSSPSLVPLLSPSPPRPVQLIEPTAVVVAAECGYQPAPVPVLAVAPETDMTSPVCLSTQPELLVHAPVAVARPSTPNTVSPYLTIQPKFAAIRMNERDYVPNNVSLFLDMCEAEALCFSSDEEDDDDEECSYYSGKRGQLRKTGGANARPTVLAKASAAHHRLLPTLAPAHEAGSSLPSSSSPSARTIGKGKGKQTVKKAAIEMPAIAAAAAAVTHPSSPPASFDSSPNDDGEYVRVEKDVLEWDIVVASDLAR
ncbi:hypothetical protein H9P43_009798 [Blastocladiella emersonii ATCC 22665]|nr:hypothetical protein H9P43_009787 [Blastocladiella emersonii ATCC 22665]KAI9151183.1 hypothetical protein H9P43_009798 [Blastocladiella emersonii ATCC 22665]